MRSLIGMNQSLNFKEILFIYYTSPFIHDRWIYKDTTKTKLVGKSKNYHEREYISSIQHKNLTSYRFVVELSQMLCLLLLTMQLFIPSFNHSRQQFITGRLRCIITKVVELNVSRDANICKLIHKRCHLKSCHGEINTIWHIQYLV